MLSNIIFVISVITFIEVEGVKYLGCYETNINSKLLHGHAQKDNKLTPLSCVDLCVSKNYTYAGVQGNECRCGQEKPPAFVRLLDKECNHACIGDKREKCGRVLVPNAASIYETRIRGNASISSRVYMGCVDGGILAERFVGSGIDKSRLPMELLYGSYEAFHGNNSPEKCHQHCYHKGYRFFALTRDTCSCGDDLPVEHPVHAFANESQCGLKCSGNANEYCGDEFKFSLHATGIPNIPEDNRFVGCFIHTEANELEWDLTWTLDETNSNQRCLNICDLKGYQYSGVNEGKFCSCTNLNPNSLDVNFQQRSFVCEETSCPGEVSQKCGSTNAIKVFETRQSSKNKNPTSTKPRYIGCYKDEKQYRDLHEVRLLRDDMTVHFCIETCKAKGYAFSGLHNSSECICSHLFPSTVEKGKPAECQFPCKGDRKQHCGGLLGRGVYDNGLGEPLAYAQYVYIGCYEDYQTTHNPYDPVLMVKETDIVLKNLSPTLCHKYCLQYGYKYFGLHYNLTKDGTTNIGYLKICFCSDEYPRDDVKYAHSFKTCPSYGKSVVFRTGLLERNLEDHYKGCYDTNNTLMNDKIFYSMSTLTPKRCLMLCDMLKFAYAGVSQGWNCRCGNVPPDSDSLADEELCDIRCPGDPNETCGGIKNHMKIYRTTVVVL